MSPVPRRDSLELRGRASTVNSVNGIHPDSAQPHGLERVIESLKLENGDLKKSLRELDDRCTKPQTRLASFLLFQPSFPFPVILLLLC